MFGIWLAVNGLGWLSVVCELGKKGGEGQSILLDLKEGVLLVRGGHHRATAKTRRSRAAASVVGCINRHAPALLVPSRRK